MGVWLFILILTAVVLLVLVMAVLNSELGPVAKPGRGSEELAAAFDSVLFEDRHPGSKKFSQGLRFDGTAILNIQLNSPVNKSSLSFGDSDNRHYASFVRDAAAEELLIDHVGRRHWRRVEIMGLFHEHWQTSIKDLCYRDAFVYLRASAASKDLARLLMIRIWLCLDDNSGGKSVTTTLINEISIAKINYL